MRQWHVNPKSMCNQHLLGEHVEHHMFIGTLEKEKKIDGFLANNLLEPLSLQSRHQELVEEMQRRGFNHKSPLKEAHLGYLSEEQISTKIDRDASMEDLFARCKNCHESSK